MTITSIKFLKACTLSVALLGSAAVVSILAVPDYAYAKNGDGGGNGSGNGGGNGGGQGASKSGSDSGADNARSKSGRSDGSSKKSSGQGFTLKGLFGEQKAKPTTNANRSTSKETRTKPNTAKVQRSSVKTTPEVSMRPASKPQGNRVARLLGVHPSELGALNAWNANENAFQNASVDSRVGRIATYRDAVMDGAVLDDQLADLVEELANLPEPREFPSIDADLEAANSAAETLTGTIADLEAIPDEDRTEEEVSDLSTARDDLAAAEQTVSDLTLERETAEAYPDTVADLKTDIADLTDQVLEQTAVERAALEEAANKPVSDELETALRQAILDGNL